MMVSNPLFDDNSNGGQFVLQVQQEELQFDRCVTSRCFDSVDVRFWGSCWGGNRWWGSGAMEGSCLRGVGSATGGMGGGDKVWCMQL